MLVGLVSPDGGTISLGSQKLNQLPIHKRAQMGISYLPQEASAFRRLSVEHNLHLVWQLRGIPKPERDLRTDRLLQEFSIEHLRQSIAISLSGGERRRLEIARALAEDPDYLLLDEPFTGVDPITIGELQSIVRELLRRRNIGILLTDHNPRATLSITDRAYIVQDGQVLVEGSASQVATNDLARRYYLGEDFELPQASSR
jgi:lipopolysaccharide export system ATP-binding protein